MLHSERLKVAPSAKACGKDVAQPVEFVPEGVPQPVPAIIS
jgi:hypothetical protein